MVGDGNQIIQTVIGNDPWNYGNLPETHVKLTFIAGKGFAVEMWCYETGMRAVNQEPDSPVYEDSCMECFLNFYPEESKIYLNFEVNSLGTMLCQIGEGKIGRRFIRDMGLEQPLVTAEQFQKDGESGRCGWKISYLIPLSLIEQIYGKAEFEKGHVLKGNFYKCGNLTEHEHYGCWNQIEVSKPNYHLQEFFGELCLDKI